MIVAAENFRRGAGGLGAMASVKFEENRFPWRKIPHAKWKIYFAGDQRVLPQIQNLMESLQVSDPSQTLARSLVRMPNEWGVMVESDKFVFGATDKIRSYPVFYLHGSSQPMLSNTARSLLVLAPGTEFHPEALTEFRMAGYVTGPDTVIRGIQQLQAGELYFAKTSGSLTLHRYYQYKPDPVEAREEEYLEELRSLTETIFRELAEGLQGRKVLIPLSSGLDSRLIVGLLRHIGYDNAETFSYGPQGNQEARIAEQVAKQAGYPWRMVPTTHAGYRRFFWSESRRLYWNFSDDLCTVPNMQDIVPLEEMQRRGFLPDDAVVINGQSGDFTSGGHIPSSLLAQADLETLKREIMAKHFSLRKSLLTAPHLGLLNRRLEASLEKIKAGEASSLSLAAMYESWEWQERQCKYVVNGQRIYDWMGLDWKLPLWDARYLDFWQKVPLVMKQDQRLYKKYLHQTDYLGLFKKFGRAKWAWFGPTAVIPPLANVIRLVAGSNAKKWFYSSARYWGHYGPQFAPFGVKKFLREASDIRNGLAFHVDEWLKLSNQGIEK